MSEVQVLDHGFLALDGVMASDLAVVNAARVSLNQSSEQLSVADEGLIKFLMNNKHGTPFEHGCFRFIVKCPLFVAREWHRHRIGWSYNEWSGRYSVIDPEFYLPEEIRTQVGKPGAYSFEPMTEAGTTVFREVLSKAYDRSFDRYEYMLDLGVAKEQARLVLPMATYTKFYATCNPRSLMNFLELRNAEQAMWEIRQYAIAAEKVLGEHMPATHQAFLDNGRVAP